MIALTAPPTIVVALLGDPLACQVGLPSTTHIARVLDAKTGRWSTTIPFSQLAINTDAPRPEEPFETLRQVVNLFAHWAIVRWYKDVAAGVDDPVE